MSTPTRWILWMLAGSVAVQWGAAMLLGFQTDSGYFVPMAREVARGYVPLRDFPTHYPPGSYYMLAVLGSDLLAHSEVVRAYLFAINALGSWLLYRILLRRSEPGLALLLALLYLAWASVLQAKWTSLEPFQNLFLLGAWLALLRWPGTRGVLVAGLCGGAALMMKQYSLLAVPGLWLLATSPDGAWPWRFDAAGWGRAALRIALFGVALGLPFALFVVATGQDFSDAFLEMAGFGGDVGRYSYGWGLQRFRRILEMITVGPSAAMLLPIAGMWLWLTWLRPSWERLALGVVFLGSFGPIAIRGYPHYFVLILPWAIVALADFAREMGDRYGTADAKPGVPGRVQELIVAVAVLGVTPLIVYGTAFGVGYLAEPRWLASEHRAIAKEIRKHIEDPTDVLVVNHTYLYQLADLLPPDRDFRWPRAKLGYENMNGVRDRARHVVLMPGEDESGVRAWIEAGGLVLQVTLDSPWGKGQPVLIYGRPE